MGRQIKEFLSLSSPAALTKKLIFVLVRDALEGPGTRVFRGCVCIAVPESLQKEMFSVIKELYDLPQETKAKNRSEYPFRRYTAHIPQIPFFEATMPENF
ncbi:hypothetical protein AMTRI_Chr01g130620 [Amborella trichopoda]